MIKRTTTLVALIIAALMFVVAPGASADDGQLLRKSMSSAPGSSTDPVWDAEHAFIKFMSFYVPAQASNGAAATVDYYDIDGALSKSETVARPLIGAYIHGPVVGVDGTGFVGHGARDAFAAVSLDDGNTWKRTNLSNSADQSSFTVSIPFPDPTDTGDPLDEIEFDPNGLIIDDTEIDVEKSKVELKAKGHGAERKDKVYVRDAFTQEIFGKTKAEDDGKWEFETKFKGEPPCMIQAGVDGVYGPPVVVDGADPGCAASTGPALITDYPGDVVNIFHAVAGNRVVVAWPSRFCERGSPGYTADAALIGAYLGIDVAADLYLTDLFGVAGAQGSVDYSSDAHEPNQAVGEVPYNCLWTARGVLVSDDDPNTTEIEESYMVWFQAERLTSGRRDVNRVEIRMVEGAGAAITWQEDPEGLRPGQGEGPGEGWSGAIANNQTDIWYSFLPWEHFDVVNDAEQPVPLPEYTGTTKPKAFVPFAIPMRLTNNARCNATSPDDAYCNGTIASPFGLEDQCADTVNIPLGPQGNLQPICVSAAGLPNVGNTAATRPRLSLQARDDNGDGVTDGAWVVVIAEEDKGFGRFFFDNTDPGTDFATPCTDETLDTCETADIGKNIWYYSFDMGSAQTSLDTSDTSLVANLVNQGNILNQAEVNWRSGLTFLPMQTLDMWDYSNSANGQDYNFLIYRTEIARRGSLLVQSPSKAAGSNSGLVAMPAWKQGLLRQGGPADVMVRRIDYDFVNTAANASDNPYDFRNIACSVWLVNPGTNPYYPDGMCADFPINLSGTTPYVCEQGSQSPVPDCPIIDADGIASFDPADQQLFNDEISWFQCPGSPLCGTTAESTALGSNLDDQSWHNPLDVAKGHRGFLDGDFVMMLYAWSPNWKKNAVGSDRYELYIRRSFDGGVTWTTTPAAFGGNGTTTCETWRAPEGTTDEPRVCTTYGIGDPEQARNVSQLRSMRFTILDPRYTATPGSIDDPLDALSTPIIPTDTRDSSRFFIVYETGDNTTVADGEAEPLDLFYSRGVFYGDHYQVWAEETDLSVCYPSDPHGTTVPTELVGSGFCNEFDDLEGRRDTESSEASVTASPYGDFLYAVWAQAQHDATTGELLESDAMFRRVWYLDDFISPTNAWTLPGTTGGTTVP
jgi:hypothetical protein